MTDSTTIEAICVRGGLSRAEAELLASHLRAFPDLSQALDAWSQGGAVDPELVSIGYTYRQLVEQYRFSPLRSLDLLAQLRVDPKAENFLTRRYDRVMPRRHDEPPRD
jgi:hypothetical protein